MISYASYVPHKFARSPACRARNAGGIALRAALSRAPDRLVDLCQGGGGHRRHVGSPQGTPPEAGRAGGGGLARGRASDALPGRQREAGAAAGRRRTDPGRAHARRGPPHPVRLYPGRLRLRLRLLLHRDHGGRAQPDRGGDRGPGDGRPSRAARGIAAHPHRLYGHGRAARQLRRDGQVHPHPH